MTSTTSAPNPYVGCGCLLAVGVGRSGTNEAGVPYSLSTVRMMLSTRFLSARDGCDSTGGGGGASAAASASAVPVSRSPGGDPTSRQQ